LKAHWATHTILYSPVVMMINLFLRLGTIWPFAFASLLLNHRILWITGSHRLKSLFSWQRMVCRIWINSNCFHTFPRCGICIIFWMKHKQTVFVFIALLLIMHAISEKLRHWIWFTKYSKHLYVYINASFLVIVNTVKGKILNSWCMLRFLIAG